MDVCEGILVWNPSRKPINTVLVTLDIIPSSVVSVCGEG